MTTRTAALEIVAPPGTPVITMTREVDAPRELVFRCYTEPALLAQWMGPRRLTNRVEALEPRHGGVWAYTAVDTDGSEYAFRGVFHGDPSPDLMIQTFEFLGAPGQVSLDRMELQARGGGRTVIHTTSVFGSVEARDAMIAAGMEGGVREGFERLDELVDRMQAA